MTKNNPAYDMKLSELSATLYLNYYCRTIGYWIIEFKTSDFIFEIHLHLFYYLYDSHNMNITNMCINININIIN